MNVRFKVRIMARVSQEHLAARRQQILDGAARCFARDGFHGTSMQDVLKESGLSAGAVYRYFRSKDEIIEALAMTVLERVGGTFDEALTAGEPPPPEEILPDILDRIWTELRFPPSLVVQVWAETLRNERLAAILHRGVGQVLRYMTEIVDRYQRRDGRTPEVPAAHVARVLVACAQGMIVQRALSMDTEPELLRSGLRGVMALGADKAVTDRRPGG
jgi:AcrR family transcriptional regulator